MGKQLMFSEKFCTCEQSPETVTQHSRHTVAHSEQAHRYGYLTLAVIRDPPVVAHAPSATVSCQLADYSQHRSSTNIDYHTRMQVRTVGLQLTNYLKQKMTTQRATSKQKNFPAHATTNAVIYVFVTVTSTRFRATVQTTGDGSQPLLTGAWESLSHRCRLPVQ